MPRLLFEKKGNAVWISHLDLMRLFQRAFKRAGLHLKHTQGFNPRPSVSIALPLSVGVESVCELLDFELEGEVPGNDEICVRLNAALVDGLKVLKVYDGGRKIRDLALLECQVTMLYDGGIPAGAEEAIGDLFRRDSLVVQKKSKSGPVDQDILPMIKDLKVTSQEGKQILLHAIICCQNPSLNPALLAQAVQVYLPQYQPDFSRCIRLEILDPAGKVFR